MNGSSSGVSAVQPASGASGVGVSASAAAGVSTADGASVSTSRARTAAAMAARNWSPWIGLATTPFMPASR